MERSSNISIGAAYSKSGWIRSKYADSGVKEKTIAARRTGISQIIFPLENKKDFEDLDEIITKDIKPHFVKNFEDVLPICFPKLKEKIEKKKAKK